MLIKNYLCNGLLQNWYVWDFSNIKLTKYFGYISICQPFLSNLGWNNIIFRVLTQYFFSMQYQYTNDIDLFILDKQLLLILVCVYSLTKKMQIRGNYQFDVYIFHVVHQIFWGRVSI